MKNIYQHFRKEEQSFINQVLDWITQVDNQYTPYLTMFLNPREQYITKTVVGQYNDIKIDSFGGYKAAEQKRMLIYPTYHTPTVKDFDLALFEIDYPKKFSTLSHGQILGTILGIGISRGNLGDIITNGKEWQFFIDSKMKKFLLMNLDKVGRTNVQLKELPLKEYKEPLDKWHKKNIIISSLRLDAIIAKSMNLSRNDASKLINQNKIKINWAVVDQPDLIVDLFDLISVRGFGRIQIRKVKNRTRKNNLVLEIGLINRNM